MIEKAKTNWVIYGLIFYVTAVCWLVNMVYPGCANTSAAIDKLVPPAKDLQKEFLFISEVRKKNLHNYGRRKTKLKEFPLTRHPSDLQQP